MRSICVFCGSSLGTHRQYREAARELGALLAEKKCRLIYGGGSVGLMGVLADSALAAGGEVIGVIPRALAHKELLHPRLSQTHIVETMHARKALMAELSEAVIVLPGGLGTFDELFEIVTWNQLGFVNKPVGLLNVRAYFDPLLKAISHGVMEGFIPSTSLELLRVAETPASLWRLMKGTTRGRQQG